MKVIKEALGNNSWTFSNLGQLDHIIGAALYNMIAAKYPGRYFFDITDVFSGDLYELAPNEADICMQLEEYVTLADLKELRSFLKSNTDFLGFDVLIDYDDIHITNINDLTFDAFEDIIDVCKKHNTFPFVTVRFRLLENPFFG